MKFKLLFWTIALFLLALPFANAGQPDNRSHLAIYYQMNNDTKSNNSLVYDFSEELSANPDSFINNGTINIETAGAPIYNTTKAICGAKSLSFSPDQVGMIIPDNDNLNFSSDFTLSMWVRFNVEPPGDRVVVQREADWDSANGFSLYFAGTEGSDFYVFEAKNPSGVKHISIFTGSTSFDATTKHLVTVVRNSTDATTYVNGTLQSVDTSPAGTTGDSTDNLQLGKDAISGAFDGVVDEFQIWHRSLNKGEILKIWNNGACEEITPPDTTKPIGNGTINNTSPRINDFVNISLNVSDETALKFANLTINFTTGRIKINYTLSGTNAQISNSTQITDSRGNVLNFSWRFTDVTGNVGQNDTLVTVVNNCVYSGSGDFVVGAEDNCQITTTEDLAGNNLIIKNSGIVDITGKVINFARVIVNNAAQMVCRNANGCFGG